MAVNTEADERIGGARSDMQATVEVLETDYLVLGAGAMAMAFVDVILDEDPAAHLTIVDRRAGPGGHWNDAYPFVRLHQPAAFYGLNSTYLGQGGADLASGPEIVGYFNKAMNRFLETGRVRFLPMTSYVGDGVCVSVVNPNHMIRVAARRRIVDATYSSVQIPALTPPRYVVDDSVDLVAPNGLAKLTRSYDRYVIVGAGKTGIDAITFLLNCGVPAERIQWIVPNDSWMFDRAQVQPQGVLGTITALVESVVNTGDIDAAYLRLERQGIVCRVDQDRLPTKWRCATIDSAELAHLRRITNVVRLGRISRVLPGRIELDGGIVDCPLDSLFVDCTADGLAKLPRTPLFTEALITLQPVFMCQQTFSAAVIARLEMLDTTDERRNRICVPVPHPESKEDLRPALLASVRNMLNCNRAIPLWLRRSRLYLAHHEPLHRYLFGSAKLAWSYLEASRRGLLAEASTTARATVGSSS